MPGERWLLQELESTETQLLEKDASLQVELEKRCVLGTTQMILLMVQKSGDHQLHVENILNLIGFHR